MAQPFHALQTAITLATRQRDALRQRYAHSLRQIDFAQRQLDQLTHYTDEINARWISAQHTPRSAELVHHHYQFLDRLQHAAQLQHTVLQQTRQQANNHQAALLAAETRLAAMEQLLAQRQRTLHTQAQRREQRETDAFATLKHIQNLAARTGETP